MAVVQREECHRGVSSNNLQFSLSTVDKRRKNKQHQQTPFHEQQCFELELIDDNRKKAPLFALQWR